MCQPNNPEARQILQHTIRSWGDPSRTGPATVPRGLGLIEKDWNRVADIFYLHSDLLEGQHQTRRGGASISKAITLVQASTKARGGSAASLWKKWSAYKDAAHLVTAANVVCREARLVSRHTLGPRRPEFHSIPPVPHSYVIARSRPCRWLGIRTPWSQRRTSRPDRADARSRYALAHTVAHQCCSGETTGSEHQAAGPCGSQ